MPSLDETAEATRLVGAGYRAISNQYRSVSRIDREDWREHMAERHAPWDPEGEGMQWVRVLGPEAAADFYRRVYSKDKLSVTDDVYYVVKKAGAVDHATEFLPLC